MKLRSFKKGIILPQVLVFASIAIILITALISWADVNVKASRKLAASEQAFNVAEAGIEYYRWHLAHAPQDFQDGTGTSSPSTHIFNDENGNQIGSFTLTITPPPTGSTEVTVLATSSVLSDPTVTREIKAQFAIPSLANYAVISNSAIRFGEGTEVFGPIQSNGGIRFDGVAHNLVTSAVSSYDDPDSDDCNGGSSFGVHTCESPADPSPPTAVPTRSDIFMAGRQFPVPAIDFNGLTTNLAGMKTDAQSNGKYLAPSGAQGYHIILKTNGTFDVYKVTNQLSAPTGCSNSASGWGTWTIRTSPSGETFVGNYPNPSNGIIFVEDNVWVEGQINGARISIAAAKLPASGTSPNIIVNSDLKYTKYDGSDVISLIAQGNILTGLGSADTERIDGALVAQNGEVGRYYYGTSCNTGYIRTALTLDGMIASNLRYGFAYTDGTGYQTRTIIYDANLLFGPPPSFPLTSSQYSLISWQEVQ